MGTDPTAIQLAADPRTLRLSGTTLHGNLAFDVPFITEIVSGLWQGGCKNGLVLPGHIRHIVSLYPWEAYQVRHELSSAMAVFMLDSTDQDMGLVDAVAAWVNACRATREPVLVCCQAGLNRSAAVTARALMLGGMTADAAITLIREKRSPASLCNPAFERWLREHDGAPAGDFTRVYTRRGRIAHLMRPTESPNTHGSVLCPVQPLTLEGWLGTGDQQERDKAGALPTCARCRERAAGSDPGAVQAA